MKEIKKVYFLSEIHSTTAFHWMLTAGPQMIWKNNLVYGSFSEGNYKSSLLVKNTLQLQFIRCSRYPGKMFFENHFQKKNKKDKNRTLEIAGTGLKTLDIGWIWTKDAGNNGLD